MGRKITFCTYDAPLFHSVNTWLKRLLPELAKNKFSVSVLVFYEGDLTLCDTHKFLLDSGFTVKAFPFKSIAEEKIQWILKTLSVDPPDIFVPNMLVHASFAAGWLKKAGIATVGVVHSDEKFYRGFVEVFVNGKEEYKLTSVIAVSKYLYNQINSNKPADVLCRCIPCGVPVKIVPKTSFHTPVLRMIYVGRLADKQKRISLVVKAMCQASNKIDGVEGIIYGHGEETKVISLIQKHSLNNKVKFGGPLLNTEVFNTLSTSQVFVLLSDYEGLPQSLLEAMACGLVPVCSDIKSGIPELITNNQTGILVKNRHSSFVTAIHKLKNDRSLCEKISENVKQKVIEYSLDACVDSWVKHLNELLLNKTAKYKIEIPAAFYLPKPHPNFKMEDFRTPSASDKLMQAVRETKLFHFIKKIVSPN